ncbi:MAG: response regulator, partial [Thiobacillus sp.]
FMDQPASFDLVITDQTMPHMTGEMLAREVLKVRAEVPIILCSGNGQGEAGNAGNASLVRSRAIGIREFMTKPYERSEMSQVIRRMLD